MTGKEKIRAAFTKEGALEVPVVIPYEGILIRDHWEKLTNQPWYAMHLPDIMAQVQWYTDVLTKINQDWFVVYPFYSKKERESIRIELFPEKICLIDTQTNKRKEYFKPRVAGWSISGQIQSVKVNKLPETISELEVTLPEKPQKFDRQKFYAEGRHELAEILIKKFSDRMPICHVSSPLWKLYGVFGFEGMMTMIAENPDFVVYACERFLEISIDLSQQFIAAGAEVLWIEECLTDMISPSAFERFNVPFMKKLVSAIRECGGKSIYYYCGNPWDRINSILSVGTDAISFEEGKKGFEINIEDVVEAAKGRCVVFGNLDAINLLPYADRDTLKKEIKRQIQAGIKNKRRFIMSLGSPVTPGTSIEQVQNYCNISRELGQSG
ncbi:MAG TPA: uroporphyrinogen decarboxylase family protein [Candidatus Ratteibacteria bacterium]|nr:uroporphyrinogen decarboxylase family protein [bacterium]HRS06844.1 uroporphyrinogen decarboxylase family protein [Candidatus Ratteibacteria bacterium]